MQFEQVLEEQFPGSQPIQSYFSRLQTALYRYGFNRTSALLIVGLCRDELTSQVTRELMSSWGNGFVMNGLAGMLCGGVTSLQAAAAHAPVHNGRERVLLVAQAHVAVGANGEIGQCSRPGRLGHSTACGALAALASAVASGEVPKAIDPDDAEFQWLWRRLGPQFEAGTAPELVALTRAAHEAIVQDADRLMATVIDSEKADYAVATGIQVHGPGGREYVWPGTHYVVVDGKRSEEDLGN